MKNLLKYIIVFILATHYGYMVNKTYFHKEVSPIIDTLPIDNGKDIILSNEKEPTISMSYDTYQHILKTKQMKDIEKRLDALFYRANIEVKDIKENKVFKEVKPQKKEKDFSGMGSCNWQNCMVN